MQARGWFNRFFFLFWFYFFATILSRPLQRIFTRSIGNFFYLIMPATRKAVKKNLEMIIGKRRGEKEISAIARRTFQNYGQYLLDYMVMHRINAVNKDKIVERELGQEYMIEALGRGKGVICITPHLGNWELGGMLLAFKGCDLYVLTLDELDPKTKIFRERMRVGKGIKNIYIDDKHQSPAAVLEVVKVLKENNVVAMLGDRPGNANTVELDFFGHRTRFPVGVATLAMATGAAVLPVFVVLKKGGKYWGIIERPIYFESTSRQNREREIRRGMEVLVKIFERYIGTYPDQWYNFYPYWSHSSSE